MPVFGSSSRVRVVTNADVLPPAVQAREAHYLLISKGVYRTNMAAVMAKTAAAIMPPAASTLPAGDAVVDEEEEAALLVVPAVRVC